MIVIQVIFVLASCNFCCHGKGVVEVKLVSYKNPSHRDDADACCESRGSRCAEKCKNLFTVCRSFNSTVCSNDVATDPFYDDELTFPTSIGVNLNNPIPFKFDTWKKEFFVNIKAINAFEEKNTLIAKFEHQFTNQVTSADKKVWETKTMLYGARYLKELTIEVSASCDVDYLLPDCTVMKCKPRDDVTGHYNCDNETKVCKEGWMNIDSNCTIQRNIKVPKLSSTSKSMLTLSTATFIKATVRREGSTGHSINKNESSSVDSARSNDGKIVKFVTNTSLINETHLTESIYKPTPSLEAVKISKTYSEQNKIITSNMMSHTKTTSRNNTGLNTITSIHGVTNTNFSAVTKEKIDATTRLSVTTATTTTTTTNTILSNNNGKLSSKKDYTTLYVLLAITVVFTSICVAAIYLKLRSKKFAKITPCQSSIPNYTGCSMT